MPSRWALAEQPISRAAPDLPDDALVLLVGPAGAGKSTWARERLPMGTIVSSDEMRALVAGDPADQGASADAFRVLHAVVEARLRRGLLTVVDATNLLPFARRQLARLARGAGRPSVAIVFDVSLGHCLAWNAARPGRRVSETVVREQVDQLRTALASLPSEGHDTIHVLRESDLAPDPER